MSGLHHCPPPPSRTLTHTRLSCQNHLFYQSGTLKVPSPAKWAKPRCGWLHLYLGTQDPSPCKASPSNTYFWEPWPGQGLPAIVRDCVLTLHFSALPFPCPRSPRSEVPAVASSL